MPYLYFIWSIFILSETYEIYWLNKCSQNIYSNHLKEYTVPHLWIFSLCLVSTSCTLIDRVLEHFFISQWHHLKNFGWLLILHKACWIVTFLNSNKSYKSSAWLHCWLSIGIFGGSQSLQNPYRFSVTRTLSKVSEHISLIADTHQTGSLGEWVIAGVKLPKLKVSHVMPVKLCSL